VKTFTKTMALLVVSSMLAACGGHSGVVPSQNQSLDRSASPLGDRSSWRPIFTTMPATNVDYSTLAEQNGTSTIPFFTGQVTSPLDHNKYTFWIAGADPHTSKTTTNITYVPIVAKVKFPDGTLLDPTKPACNDTVAVQDRFFKGPNFVPVPLKSNGVNVGTDQITDAHQRAEFWNLVKNTGYHTMLKASAAPIIVTIKAPPGSTTQGGVCAGSGHNIGLIDFNAYDTIIRGLATSHAKVNQVPLVLTYNVVQTSQGQCCIIGYHSDFGRGSGTQVYSVGAYTDQLFTVPGIQDIHAWTHEIGELFNDPFVGSSLQNQTPLWGHVGQVSGCQGNLEVGDPLTGTAFPLTVNGFHYHPQELTFFDWFYRTPSQGTGGKYSFEGTFTTVQGTCT